jgi:hypothetical protein
MGIPNDSCWNGWPKEGNPDCYCRQYDEKRQVGYKMFPNPEYASRKTYRITVSFNANYNPAIKTTLRGVTSADAAGFIADVMSFASSDPSSITWRSAHFVKVKHSNGEYLVKTHLIQEILVTEE